MAKPGYTILIAGTSNLVINQFTMKLPIDPLVDLTPIAKIVDVPLVLFSNPAVPVKNFAEFITHAKKNPGKLNYGSPAPGSVNHLLLERIKQAIDLDMVHVPFRGTPPGVIALMSNEIQLFTVGLQAGFGQVKEGKLTALAVATKERLDMLPEVPTLIESGLPGFIGVNWWALAAPRGTPDAIIGKLRAAVTSALQDPQIIARFATMGLLVPAQTPGEFAAGLKDEAELWAAIAQRGRISIQ